MLYSILNFCVIIAVFFFYRLRLRYNTNSEQALFYPIINLCIMQSSAVVLLYILELTSFPTHLIIKFYIFSVYYCLLVLFKFACVFNTKKTHTYCNYVLFFLTLITLYYTFFYLDISTNVSTRFPLDSDASFGVIQFELGHYAFTPYAFVIPGVSLLILVIRFFIEKDNVVRYKLILIAFVFITFYFFYTMLVFKGAEKRSINFVYSFATLYILFVLYRIMLVNHIPSFQRALKAGRTFFWEYMLFAIFVTVVFVIFFHALSINLAIFAISGLAIIFLLFYAQALIRKKNKAAFIRDIAEVALGNYFSNIDYTSNKEGLFASFTNMLTDVFDASAVDFFVVEEEELYVTYSTRNNYSKKMSLNTNLFSAICHSKVPVISRNLFYKEKSLHAIENDEVEKLFEYCNSHAIIIIHGERSIIGLITLGEKKRSVNYSEHEINLMRYFYPNFFVFGYYLQTSVKETMMKVIAREIEFSGQVTESIYKTIDKIKHKSIETGYLLRSLRNLGGDFIDFIRLTEDRHMLVVGDVSGRGLNASMCMIILKSFIRTFLSESNDFLGLLDKLNKFIKHNLPRGTFFAGTFMIYDNSDKMLYYVNCGVPGIFLYTKAYNNVIEIQGEGKVLGFVDNILGLLTIKKIQLNIGDIILTCSDGVTESLSLRGEEYGKRRIENLLLENRLFPAQNICSFLYDDLQTFTAKGLSDDISVLVLKVLE